MSKNYPENREITEIPECAEVPRGYRIRNAQTDGGAGQHPTRYPLRFTQFPATDICPFSVSHGELTYIIPDFRFFVKGVRAKNFSRGEERSFGGFSHVEPIGSRKKT